MITESAPPQPSRRPPTGVRAASHHAHASQSLARLATATQVLVITSGRSPLTLTLVKTMGAAAGERHSEGDGAAFALPLQFNWAVLLGNMLVALSVIGAAALWAAWQYRVANKAPGHRATCKRTCVRSVVAEEAKATAVHRVDTYL